ncbi:MAG TPA: carboxymuconolactone decarboxylase family protein [Opitutaceae bacterium]
MKTLTILMSFALTTMAAAQEITVTRATSEVAQRAPAENFTGTVRVERLFGAVDPARATGGLVHFEAGARTNWHTHPLGQILIVTAGVGRVQHWGGPVQEIRKGDTVRIPPNVKHWHGASPAAAMSHIAISEQLDGKTVEWDEKVSDAEFNAPTPGQPAAAATSGPTRAQQLVGDIAPKLAELTDHVLFADVWARPQLARRDRSLVTVSALVAMNRPDQLRSHLALAKQNRVTEEELVEAITHLAFYAGWPSAMSAAGVAKEIFRKQ